VLTPDFLRILVMKKFLAATIGATLLAAQGVAAAEAPNLPNRTASPVGESEGAMSGALIALIFAAIGAGIIVAVEDSESDAPTSP